MLSKSRNDQHRRIGDSQLPYNATEICDNAAGIGDNTAKVSPLLISVLNGDWSNSVPGGQFPKGKGAIVFYSPIGPAIIISKVYYFKV